MARHRPYNIKIELVRGCTLRCPFCALPEMDWADGPWKFMEEDLYYKLIDDLSSWLGKIRIEFAERGEQSFHPKLFDFIEYTRNVLPLSQMMITSNGDTIRRWKEYYKDWV